MNRNERSGMSGVAGVLVLAAIGAVLHSRGGLRTFEQEDLPVTIAVPQQASRFGSCLLRDNPCNNSSPDKSDVSPQRVELVSERGRHFHFVDTFFDVFQSSEQFCSFLGGQFPKQFPLESQQCAIPSVNMESDTQPQDSGQKSQTGDQ